MCGGAARGPKVTNQGPDKKQLAAQQAQIDEYKKQSRQQQEALAAQLQAQIDAVAAETARREAQLQQAREAAALAALPKTYGADATAAFTQTTEATTRKKKPNEDLRIASTAAAAMAPGTGLNIGV